MTNWARDVRERYATATVEKRSRHALHLRQSDGKRVAVFSGLPCHYQDKEGRWQELDTALTWRRDHWGADGVPVRIAADKTISVEGVEYSQRTTRVGLLDATSNAKSAQDVSGASVDGDSVVTTGEIGGAPWEHRLRVTPVGLRETMTLEKQPAIDKASDSDWLTLETLITGKAFADGQVSEYSKGAVSFPTPHAWDAKGREAECKRYASTRDGAQYLYTCIPLAFLKDAAYPVTIDPDFAGSTADAMVYGQSTTYSTARSTAAANTDTARWNVGQYAFGSDRQVFRSFLKFDTSSLGAGVIVTGVTLKLTIETHDAADTAFTVQIVKQDWSGQDPISSANREAAYDGCLSGTADSNPWRNTADGISDDTQYTSGALDTSWVNKTGNTYYSLRSSRDVSGTEPSGEEYLRCHSASASTVGFRPVLAVTYSYAQAGAGAWEGAGVQTRSTAKPVAGAWEGVGALARAVGKALAGAWSGVGELASELSSGATEYLQDVAGAWAGAGDTVRSVARAVAGAMESAGALVRSVGKPSAGAWEGVGAPTQQTGKVTGGAWDGSGAPTRAMTTALAGVWDSAGAVARAVSTAAAGAWAGAGDLARTTSTALSGALTGAGDVVRSTGKALAGAASWAGETARAVGKILSGVWEGAGDGAGVGGHMHYLVDVAGAWIASGGATKTIARALSGAWAGLGALVRWVFGQTPSERTYTVVAEDRSLTRAAESRAYAVAAEVRTLSLAAQDRVYAVGAEDRTFARGEEE